jgi:hypothetical protein
MQVDIRQVLAELAQSDQYRSTGTAATFRKIAAELNRSSSPQRRWTWNYLHEVCHGRLRPSRVLVTSILRLQNTIKFRKHQVPDFETTQVLAPSGFIAPDTIICTPSRKCTSSYCDRNFVPAHPNQRYCTPECRRRARHQT